VLKASVEDYRQRHDAELSEPDEMIVSAGDYLMKILEPVQRQLDARRRLLMAAAGVGLALGTGLLVRQLWSVHVSTDSGSSNNSSSSSRGSDSSGTTGGSLSYSSASLPTTGGSNSVTSVLATGVSVPAVAEVMKRVRIDK
jgi:hypothetical protein